MKAAMRRFSHAAVSLRQKEKTKAAILAALQITCAAA
jgi:hypothetical protein